MNRKQTQMPYAEERRRAIFDRLLENGKVSVEELAAAFQVSSPTIRTDLARMEEAGLLRRTHGGAILPSGTLFEPAYSHRKVIRHAEKQAIARVAALMVDEGATILLDAGTTTFELALLLREHRSLTVVTNSIPIALVLMENQDIEVVLVGGHVQPKRQAVLGPLAVRFLSPFRVDRAFLSFNGVDAKAGFTVVDFEAAESKERMIASARCSVVLADSDKIGRVAFAQVAPVTAASCLITDGGITDATTKELMDTGLEVRVALLTKDIAVGKINNQP